MAKLQFDATFLSPPTHNAVRSNRKSRLLMHVLTRLPAHSQSSSSDHSGNCNQRLKPLKVPVFSCEKSEFKDFWEMFLSLVDQGVEPTNIKMARLRKSLTGTALEAIRGLGVSRKFSSLNLEVNEESYRHIWTRSKICHP